MDPFSGSRISQAGRVEAELRVTVARLAVAVTLAGEKG